MGGVLKCLPWPNGCISIPDCSTEEYIAGSEILSSRGGATRLPNSASPLSGGLHSYAVSCFKAPSSRILLAFALAHRLRGRVLTRPPTKDLHDLDQPEHERTGGDTDEPLREI